MHKSKRMHSMRMELQEFSPDPCRVFTALKAWEPFVLLESASCHPRIARKSLLGLGASPWWSVKNGSATALQAMQAAWESWRSQWESPAGDSYGGLFAVFSYEWKNVLENLPHKTEDDLHFPDALFLACRDLLVWDHESGSLTLHLSYNVNRSGEKAQASLRLRALRDALSGLANTSQENIPTNAPQEPVCFPEGWYADGTRAAFLDKVKKIKRYIAAGDIYQANLSQRFHKTSEVDGLLLYRTLRDINPSPFGGYLRFADWELISSSPERLIRKEGQWLQTRPIAGTRPRGKNRAADKRRREELLLSPKERSEHIMLVDLERNDIGRVCRPGTVRVDEAMAVEKYSHVQHIVSNVRGILREDANLSQILRAVFPGGTITGVPKIRCMEILEELESHARGPYTGSLGYLDSRGDWDFNILIRTLLKKQDTVYLQVGAGIVADSIPTAEYQETLDKAKAMALAVEISSAKIPRFATKAAISFSHSYAKELAQAWRQ